jgi:hypothetical protein
MTPEEYYERGKKLLAEAEGRYRSGSWDLAKVEAALASANLEAAPLQRFIESGGAQRHPFDDPRELRAWCLDRALSLRPYADDGDGIKRAIEAAERLRAYVTTGEQPEDGTDV